MDRREEKRNKKKGEGAGPRNHMSNLTFIIYTSGILQYSEICIIISLKYKLQDIRITFIMHITGYWAYEYF